MPDNDPQMISWLLEHDIIHSVPPNPRVSKSFAGTFLSSLTEIWMLHKDKSPLSQYGAANKMALLGDHVAQYFSVVKLTEPVNTPVFPSATKAPFFPNMELRWRQWGSSYLMHRASFPDAEGQECIAYIGYVGGVNPWWRILYITCNQKVTICDDVDAVLSWLSRYGIVTKEPQQISWSTGVEEGFNGAVRGGMHPHFFSAPGALKHLDFRRY